MYQSMSHGPITSSHGGDAEDRITLSETIFLLPRGFPAAPGMPRAAPRVLGTVAFGKNVWFKIARRDFQRDSLSVVAKKRKSPPLPHLKPTARRSGQSAPFTIFC